MGAAGNRGPSRGGDSRWYEEDEDEILETAPEYRRGGRDGRAAFEKKPTPAMLAGRALASVLGAAVVLTTGFVWFENKSLNDGLHTSDSVNAVKPGEDGYVAPHLGNDVNLLLIGLDSRKDMNGNDLPTDLVEGELHAGSSKIGGYNTNVLILMHIPANGGKVTAYSIPRDDYVERPGGSTTVANVGTIPDLGKGKIKEAYGDAKGIAEGRLRAAGEKDKAKIEADSREVGREATIRAVQKLTGVHVDHLAEVNLLGFYDVVKAIGSVQVCLKAPANDPIEDGAGTGINLPAGVSTLNAAQALQFVRQRFHLPNGDLDRTHRQQAFLSAVTHQLRSNGILGDIGKMQALMNVVKNDVVIDNKWDVLTFAQEASNLTGGNATFFTLPIKTTADVPDGSGIAGHTTSVNLVDPDVIKQTVTQAFNNDAAVAPPTTSAPAAPSSSAPPPPPAQSSAPAAPKQTITVDNGTSVTGLALKVSGLLYDKAGIAVTKTGNGGNVYRTTIRYGAGAADTAKKIADTMGVKAVPIESGSLASNSIVVTVGSDFRMPAAQQPSTGSTGSAGDPSSASTGDSSTSSGGGITNGGAVDMSSQDGIPCVY